MTEITARLSTALADRYKIERRLGEGGMATVYLAEDARLPNDTKDAGVSVGVGGDGESALRPRRPIGQTRLGPSTRQQ